MTFAKKFGGQHGGPETAGGFDFEPVKDARGFGFGLMQGITGSGSNGTHKHALAGAPLIP